MFTIIGGDGKEYGPATVEQLRGWITSGRANLDTKAKALGTDEWRRLGDFAEFATPDSPPPLATSFHTPPSEAGTNTEAAPLAGRGARLCAALLDRVIAALCALPGVMMLGPVFFKAVIAASRNQQFDPSDFNVAGVLLGVSVIGFSMLALFIVQLWMLCTRGQTIGKRLLGIRIVMHRGGGKADFVHVWLLRNFVVGLIGLVPWVGFLFVLVDVCFIFGPEKRCIHDFIASTKVVKA